MNGGVGRSQMIIPNTEVFASKPVNGVPRKETAQFLLSYTVCNILATVESLILKESFQQLNNSAGQRCWDIHPIP